MAPVTDTLIYDTLCEVMDLVAAVGKKVDRLLSAAGIDPDEGGQRETEAAA
jgi:hypothetical protein